MPSKNSIFPWWIPSLSERSARRIIVATLGTVIVAAVVAIVRTLFFS